MSSSPAAIFSEKGLDLRAMIAERAYYKAEQRGFAPGFEMSDWLEAERELLVLPEPTTASKPKGKQKAKSASKQKTKSAAKKKGASTKA